MDKKANSGNKPKKETLSDTDRFLLLSALQLSDISLLLASIDKRVTELENKIDILDLFI